MTERPYRFGVVIRPGRPPRLAEFTVWQRSRPVARRRLGRILRRVFPASEIEAVAL